MSTAYVLLTALPPTKGHAKLIEFAAALSDGVQVIVCTQPDEPFPYERYEAISRRFAGWPTVNVVHFHEQIAQDPETPGFREMWRGIMRRHGCTAGRDIIVASEPYGQWVADITGTTFMPYDPGRELTPVKATTVREDPLGNFGLIIEEFRRYLAADIVIFGAESTGKTTLARALARYYGGQYFFEWARPYLETVGPEITVESMTAIWKGQRATEDHCGTFVDSPLAFFDTDLFSTVGYWQLPHWAETLGPVPEQLIEDAKDREAPLYLITRSNIPFEQDPLRYGGDQREASDEYWIDMAEQYNLNYVVLESSDLFSRTGEAIAAISPLLEEVQTSLTYDRGGF